MFSHNFIAVSFSKRKFQQSENWRVFIFLDETLHGLKSAAAGQQYILLMYLSLK